MTRDEVTTAKFPKHTSASSVSSAIIRDSDKTVTITLHTALVIECLILFEHYDIIQPNNDVPFMM